MCIGTRPETPSTSRTMSTVRPRIGMQSVTRTTPSSVWNVVSSTSVFSRYRRSVRCRPPGRRDLPPAVVAVAEQRREHRARVEAGHAEPVDRAVLADQRRGLRVADERVVLDPLGHACQDLRRGRRRPRPISTSAHLDEAEPERGDRLAQRLGVRPEPVAERVDERTHRVDRDRGLGERLGPLRREARGAGPRSPGARPRTGSRSPRPGSRRGGSASRASAPDRCPRALIPGHPGPPGPPPDSAGRGRLIRTPAGGTGSSP